MKNLMLRQGINGRHTNQCSFLPTGNETMAHTSQTCKIIDFAAASVQAVYTSQTRLRQTADHRNGHKLKWEITKQLIRHSRENMGAFAEYGVSVGKKSIPGLRLESDLFGMPVLRLPGRNGPSVSFSHLGNTIWAALALKDCRIGIDASHIAEFSAEYPFARVFHPRELEFFTEIFQSPAKGAAALWSAKEATVKALGCAYHFFGPLELKIRCRGDQTASQWFSIQLSDSIKKLYPTIQQDSLPLRVLDQNDSLVAITLFPATKKRPAG